MIKAFAVLALVAVSGASVIALQLFAPEAGANEGFALAKSDRLTLRSSPQNCFEQTWPNLTTACLHNAGSDTKIVEARPVSALR
jgi:hypothetical protein